MRSLARSGVLAVVLGGLAGCAYDPQLVDDTEVVLHEYRAVRQMEPQGPAFNQGLRQGYLDYGDLMYDEVDAGDFRHFAFKAVDSAKGEAVLPDTLEFRELPGDRVEELAAARARLMAALDQTGRKKAPWEAATAQTSFDCWLEKVEENDPPEEIEICKQAYEQAIAEVERSLASDVEGVYLVFFAWDQADLSPVALTVLDQVQADFQRARPDRLTLAGHADRSGPEAYNEGLSERRARNVGRALGDRGIPDQRMTIEWFGERLPRVPTPDGVREPQNRRVEITFG